MPQSEITPGNKQLAILMVHPLVMSIIGVGSFGIVAAIFVNGFGH